MADFKILTDGIYTKVLMNGEPMEGLTAIDYHVEAGEPAIITLTGYSGKVEIEAMSFLAAEEDTKG